MARSLPGDLLFPESPATANHQAPGMRGRRWRGAACMGLQGGRESAPSHGLSSAERSRDTLLRGPPATQAASACCQQSAARTQLRQRRAPQILFSHGRHGRRGWGRGRSHIGMIPRVDAYHSEGGCGWLGLGRVIRGAPVRCTPAVLPCMLLRNPSRMEQERTARERWGLAIGLRAA